jgi:NCS1 family nucleobase:cation symporter-1
LAAQPLAELLGIEPVPDAARHGSPRQLFHLWWAANLGIPPFLVGVLGPLLGLSLLETLAAVLLGNVVASLMLAATAVTGTGQGLAQLPLSRAVFGRRGNYLPAALNFLSSLGWYTVNTFVGGGALAVLLRVPLTAGIGVVAVAQAVLAYLGYDVIHGFERVMAYVQAALFLALSIAAMTHLGQVPHVGGTGYGPFLLELAAVASYSFSWAPYASDYARYLPPDTDPRAVFASVFWGSFLSCLWVEAIGGLAGALGLGALSPVGIVRRLMGPHLAVWAELAIVFGTLTANALNSYTCTLSLLTLDLRALRPYAAAGLAVLGGIIAVLSSSHFMGDYQNFLLLLSYWIAPWIAVTLVAHFVFRRITTEAATRAPRVVWTALASFLAGIAVTIPFMNTTLFEGPLARRLDNGDISYYLGFLVAGALFWWLMARANGRGATAPHATA